jgi:hypothetical protein
VPEEKQVVDVERLVEDVRERVAYERSQGDGAGQELAVPQPAPPAYLIAVRPETIVSNKRLVGPLITFVRRVMLRILALPLQDLINQMNTAVAGVHQAVGHESNVRQALIEGEAAAREAGERDLQVVKKRFDGVDTAVNALELAHRLAIADEADAREDAIRAEAEARQTEAKAREAVARDVASLAKRLDDLEQTAEQAELVPRPRESAHIPFARVFPAPETPWSSEYVATHKRFVARMLDSDDILELFRQGDELPLGFGTGLDERVIEYPWALAHLPGGKTLDAGSTLNHAHILDRFEPRVSELHIVTLTPEDASFPERGVSYVYADLRALPLREGYYQTIVSLSTLEHVGMETGRYGGERREGDPQRELEAALEELRRVAAPSATLLATVPYGEAEDLGWLRVFDQDGVDQLVASLDSQESEVVVYAYSERGWQRSDPEAAAGARYRDYYADRTPVEDRAAAARAVACIRAVL